MIDESEIPPGWDKNPSRFEHRGPLLLAAFIGFAIAVYLTLFQIGWVPHIWDPVFGANAEKVLTSEVSRLLPIPDASLGAAVYFCDLLFGSVGGPSRWRTMPWAVLLFGLTIGPLGLASIVLVILQPSLIGAWCGLCLLSALISISMVGPGAEEALATLQFLKRESLEGRSILAAVIHGDRREQRWTPVTAAGAGV